MEQRFTLCGYRQRSTAVITFNGLPQTLEFEGGDQARSNRSRFMTLFHAATKSFTNFSCESAHP